ncbi:hypothetical protein BRPE64_DCDS05630 (plasmid) [Caballeronia insecticola]|uniref:Lipoprotein n=2 Tax=Caballeronia insecticola TaxID=758793 RepID=R4WSC7_9BURK|nr:hypothetical protein BRPE64_DCDS05630 [Caballeronia insecticola]
MHPMHPMRTMKSRLFRAMFFVCASIGAGATWAAPNCFPVGTTLTIRGTPVQEMIETDSGSQQPIWMLSMDPPLCVIDKRFSQDPQGRLLVTRVQIIGPPLPNGVQISATGTLLRRSTLPYYIVPTALWVTPPQMIPRQ